MNTFQVNDRVKLAHRQMRPLVGRVLSVRDSAVLVSSPTGEFEPAWMEACDVVWWGDGFKRWSTPEAEADRVATVEALEAPKKEQAA